MMPWQPVSEEDERLTAKPDMAPSPGQWDDAEEYPESLPIGFLAARDRALGVAPLSRYDGWEETPTPTSTLERKQDPHISTDGMVGEALWQPTPTPPVRSIST